MEGRRPKFVKEAKPPLAKNLKGLPIKWFKTKVKRIKWFPLIGLFLQE